MLAEIIRLRLGLAIILFIVLVPMALAVFDAIGPHGSSVGPAYRSPPSQLAPRP